MIPNVKNKAKLGIKDFPQNIISKISQNPNKIYKKKVGENKPDEVREILNITKVPFMYGTIQHRNSVDPNANYIRSISTMSKRNMNSRGRFMTRKSLNISKKRKKNNSVIIEEIELDKIHNEILSNNISKGMNIESKGQDNFGFLPSLKSDTENKNYQVNSNTNENRRLHNSSSMESYSLSDFKRANEYMKKQKSEKWLKNKQFQRSNLVNMSSKNAFKFSQGNFIPSFSVLNAKASTIDSFMEKS